MKTVKVFRLALCFLVICPISCRMPEIQPPIERTPVPVERTQDQAEEEIQEDSSQVVPPPLPPNPAAFSDSFQLASIREGSDEIYRANEEINSDRSSKIVVFARLLPEKKAAVSAIFLEDLATVYLGEAALRYEIRANGIHVSLVSVREAQEGAETRLTGIASLNKSAWNILDVLPGLPLPMRTALGRDGERKLPARGILRGAPKTNGFVFSSRHSGAQTYLFLPADDPEFEVLHRTGFTLDSRFRSWITDAASGSGAKFAVYADPSNQLNNNPGDDVYYSEPLIDARWDGRGLCVSVSLRRAVESLAASRDRRFADAARIFPIPGLSSVRLLVSREGGSVDRFSEAVRGPDGEVQLNLKEGEFELDSTLAVELINNSGTSVVRKQLGIPMNRSFQR